MLWPCNDDTNDLPITSKHWSAAHSMGCIDVNLNNLKRVSLKKGSLLLSCWFHASFDYLGTCPILRRDFPLMCCISQIKWRADNNNRIKHFWHFFLGINQPE